FAVLVVMMKELIVLFLGVEYHMASKLIPALVLMPIMYTMSEVTVQGINFFLKPYIHILVSGISLFTNIMLCILLIPRYGMEGAALAIALSYIVFYLTRTFWGLKYFYFNVKIKETTILIAVFV